MTGVMMKTTLEKIVRSYNSAAVVSRFSIFSSTPRATRTVDIAACAVVRSVPSRSARALGCGFAIYAVERARARDPEVSRAARD